MNPRFRDEEGAVAVIVAICLVVLLGFAALVVDAGYVYAVRRQLQTAADGAALAGCQELILGSSEAQILSVAELYAEDYNGVAPADGGVMATATPHTEVGEDYVKVSVKKDVSLWFARVLGFSGKTVYAQAKAKVAYLTGLRGIVPWAVPTVRAERVAVRLGGGAEVDLVRDEDSGEWRGAISVPTTAAASIPVAVIAYNSQTEYPDGTSDYPDGVPETVPDAGVVTVEASGSPIREVYLEQAIATAGEDTSVTLRVRASAQPTAQLGKDSYTMDLVSGDLYSCSLQVPTGVTELHRSFPVSVSVGKYTLDPAATLIVRRSTFPVRDVVISPVLYSVGATSAVANVTVKLNDYLYGQRYVLKVTGGAAEVGNFCALDLGTIKHAPNWQDPQHPSEYDLTTDPNYSTPAYYNYLGNALPFVIHIGDTIWTHTGALSGPQTDDALDERFGTDDRTFEEWEDADKPGSRRVVYVPVVEKLQSAVGRTPVRVVSLAAFYIEPGTDATKDAICGRFIEFVAPADAISETPPDAMYYLETSHLVPMDY